MYIYIYINMGFVGMHVRTSRTIISIENPVLLDGFINHVMPEQSCVYTMS